ncbi:HB2L protein, partial [Eubucco bourcierii]|nr:HB2L protein [Eubucco bourcierii]
RVAGPVAMLVALAVLGAHQACGKNTREFFQEVSEHECKFFNGTERVKYIYRFIYNRQQYLHFDSDLGIFVADLPVGEASAKHFNNQPDILEYSKAAVNTYCRRNYEVITPFSVERR